MKFATKLGLGALGLAALAVPAAASLAVAPEEAPAATPLSAEQVTKARQMFSDNGCNACHTLADASAAGAVGPSFDTDTSLTKDRAVQIITNGQGQMPNFSWLGEEDIDLLAGYIVQAKK